MLCSPLPVHCSFMLKLLRSETHILHLNKTNLIKTLCSISFLVSAAVCSRSDSDPGSSMFPFLAFFLIQAGFSEEELRMVSPSLLVSTHLINRKGCESHKHSAHVGFCVYVFPL